MGETINPEPDQRDVSLNEYGELMQQAQSVDAVDPGPKVVETQSDAADRAQILANASKDAEDRALKAREQIAGVNRYIKNNAGNDPVVQDLTEIRKGFEAKNAANRKAADAITRDLGKHI